MQDWLLEECKKKINAERSLIRDFWTKDYYWVIGCDTALRIADAIGTPVSVGDVLCGIRIGRITFRSLNSNLFVLVRSPKGDGTMTMNMTMNMIKNVIFNDPATIVIWADGTKTVVKADGEHFDPEKGLAMAISKKFFGNKGYYYDLFKKWLPKEEETKYTGTNEWSEHEVVKEDIETITLKEFCTRRNITKNKVYGMIHRGEIDAFKNEKSLWMVRVHTRN